MKTLIENELEQLLLDVIASGPGDGVQLIAADAAREAGRDYLADCLEWMYREKKWPDYDDRLMSRWTWWLPDALKQESSWLPEIGDGQSIIVRFFGAYKRHISSDDAIRALWKDWEESRSSGKWDGKMR